MANPLRVAFVLGVLLVICGAAGAAQIVWNASPIVFTKADGADWTLAQNQDRITDNVWLTRKNSQGLFNIKMEAGYQNPQEQDSPSPVNTEWAYGHAADWESLTFQTWVRWNGEWPPTMVDKDAVLHLITDDIYLDIKFLSWAVGGSGGQGGFSYQRATAAGPAPIVWGGPPIVFTKDDGADWTLAENQDRITDNVWLTRKNSQGLFNIEMEAGFQRDETSGYPSPVDTEWAYGHAADWESLTFQTWVDCNGWWPPDMVGRDAVLHLITDNIYLDIKFLSWAEGGSGGQGGFSYERATPEPATLGLLALGGLGALLRRRR